MPEDASSAETARKPLENHVPPRGPRGSNRNVTFSAAVFLLSYILHALLSTSEAHAVHTSVSPHGLGPKLTSGQEAGPDADLIRDRASTKRPRRRHQVSRKSSRKASGIHTHRSVVPERLHVTLNDDLHLHLRHERVGATGGGNSSDVIDTYEYDDVPGIWENRRVRNRESDNDRDGVPRWQRLPTAEEISRFKKLVRKTLACRKLPALTLALVKGGHVILTASLGHADPELQLPVLRSTRFAIGSLTKAFTATLVSEVLMRRNISLDTPISQLMPQSFELMDEVRTRSVTVRDLLGHRTGVPGYFHALLMGFPAHVTRQQLLSRLRYIPAVVPLRSQFLYNNYLYTLAAHVVEKLTGRSWEALVRDLILRPLGMRSTGFVDEVEDFSQFALPCALLNGTFRNLSPELLLSVSPCGPAGSLYSTAHDMARWLQMLLSNGKSPDGKRVLQENALKETTRAVMPPPGIGTDLTKPEFPIGDVEQSYGLGWVSSNYRGFKKVWHSGGIVTYSSRLWLFPGVGAGLFVATNGPQTRDKGQALTAITGMAADLLLGETFWLNSTTVCTFPAPWKRPEPFPETETSASKTPATASTATRPVKKKDQSEGSGGSQSPRLETSPPRRESTFPQSLKQLLGVYSHKAFGEIVIERGGLRSSGPDTDVLAGNAHFKETDDPGTSAGETGNASDWLLLKFGRFGQLKLKRVEGEPNGWEGRFVGPLWYVTASDESNRPISVQFLQDESGRVDRLRYPIDARYDVIEFQKRGVEEASASSSYSVSCGGSPLGSVVVTVTGLSVMNALLVRALVPS